MSADLGLGGPEPTASAPPARPVGRLGAVPGPAPGAGVPVPVPLPRPRWEIRYARAVVAADLAAVLVVVGVGHVLGLGSHAPVLGGQISPGLGLVITVLTGACLFLARAWEPRVLGQGSQELTRLIRAFGGAAVVLGLAGLALHLPAVRPWVFGLLPLAGALALAGRFGLRKWLHRHRSAGRFLHPVLVVGSAESVADLVARTRRDRHNGWRVTGACTPTGAGADGAADIAGVPVLGDLDAVAEVVRRGAHHVVSVGAAPGWSSRRLHRLAWELEGTGADLVVDPGLMEIAGPRLHVAPVDGLPLLRLTQPAFTGGPRIAKSVLDRCGAAALLVVLLPALVAIAALVRLDGGPAFFRQERVGRHGRRFRMIKFRSMVVDAEARRAGLLAVNEAAGPLFKLHHDPRVTRVGGLLRRYSLDELPQLLNVLGGSMSLVGPRPPLPEEVATYSRDAERRLLVKPGLTGLWQVSGRSNLSWEESVRLDLRYVENWSLGMDALILWKTLGALLRADGAY